MASIFMSYSREDISQAEKLEKAFKAKGLTVWRDQESIYAGEAWPQAIGRGIADQDIFLLLWSKQSETSHFVEFEWNTAIALKKTIVPVFLDNTPLPPMLRAINGIDGKDFDSCVLKILKLVAKVPGPDLKQVKEVNEKLSSIRSEDIKEVLEKVITYNQQGWHVGGDVYQAAGNIIVTKNGLSKFQWKVIVAVLALIGLTLLLDLPGKLSSLFKEHAGKPVETLVVKGMVRDIQGRPKAGVRVELDLLPGKHQMTTSGGGFIFEDVPGKVGDKVRVYVYFQGKLLRDEYKVLPGPIDIRVEE